MTTIRLHRRLEALEKELVSEAATLTMPDGSTATIPGSGDYLLRLLGRKFDCADNSREQAHLDLIRRATGSEEPGGGRMVELIRCVLLGPATLIGPRSAILDPHPLPPS
jgi:hypothetical protein